ncbi:hypothetical protein BC941DRAFT_516139 [Chlamydoabsidia padenii]|nr:hypothetical protein BC941DRAFT_516139 [Chlamydoabsidia padenii]
MVGKEVASKLSVFRSGMINTIIVEHRGLLVNCLTGPVLKSILDENQAKDFVLYQDGDIESVVPDLRKAYVSEGINAARKFIMKRKLDVFEANIDIRGSMTMIVLDIFDHIGETTCLPTNYDRRMNELEHGNVTKSIYNEIFLLVRSVDNGNGFELTSVEFKPMGVSNSTIIIQQNKNIRINKSILSRPAKHVDDSSISVIGMDIIGKSSYSSFCELDHTFYYIGLVGCLYSVKMLLWL